MSVWLNKKVFIETHSKKIFMGNITGETETTITMLDKFGHLVQVSFSDIKLIKEEF